MARQSEESLSLYKIAELKPELKNWKIKVKITLDTPDVNQKEYMRKGMSGKRCVYGLDDESGKIKLIGFNEYAKKVESSVKESVQEYFVWGAKITNATKDFNPPDRQYELKFNDDTVIEPVEAGLSPKGNETASRPDTGEIEPKKTIFDPIPLKKVSVGNPEGQFHLLGTLEKLEELEEKKHSESKSTFYRKSLHLSDGENTVVVSVIGTQEELNGLHKLKGQEIGLEGCAWKKYGQSNFISSRFEKLTQEKDLPKDKVKMCKQNGGKGGTTQGKRKPKSKQRSEDEGLTKDMKSLDVNE